MAPSHQNTSTLKKYLSSAALNRTTSSFSPLLFIWEGKPFFHCFCFFSSILYIYQRTEWLLFSFKKRKKKSEQSFRGFILISFCSIRWKHSRAADIWDGKCHRRLLLQAGECCRQARGSVGWVPADPCWSLCIYCPEGARTRMSAGGRGWNASTRPIWYRPGFNLFVLYLPSHTFIIFFFFSLNWLTAADFNTPHSLEPLRTDLDVKNWKDQEIGSRTLALMPKNPKKNLTAAGGGGEEMLRVPKKS